MHFGTGNTLLLLAIRRYRSATAPRKTHLKKLAKAMVQLSILLVRGCIGRLILRRFCYGRRMNVVGVLRETPPGFK